MFSHTSRPRNRIWGTSVRKHCFVFVFVGSFQRFFGLVFFVFFGFTMVLNSCWLLLLVFHRVSLCFGWSPLVFHSFVCSRNGFGSKFKGKLLENQSQPTPGPLRSFLLGLSRLCLLWGSFSGTSPESLLVVWPPPGSSGWLCPPPSSLCLLLRVIRKKSDSGASPELRSGALCLFSFTHYRERRIPYGLLWTCWDSPFSISPTCSGAPGLPLSLSLSSGLLGSSGWLWPPPSSLSVSCYA